MLDRLVKLRILKYFNQQTDKFVKSNEHIVSINSTPTRWGLVSFICTFSLGIAAIGISLLSIFLTTDGPIKLIALIVGSFFILSGIVLFVLIGILGVYFVTRNATKTNSEFEISDIRKTLKRKGKKS
jgi:hypothetical protein